MQNRSCMELDLYLKEFFNQICPETDIGTPYKEALIPMVCGYAVGLSIDQLKHMMAVRAYLGAATNVLDPNRKPEISEMAQLLKYHDEGVHFKTAVNKVFTEFDIQEKYLEELRKYA